MTNQELTPTKYNLIKHKKTLSLAKLGFDLMDKKRLILLDEEKKIKAKQEEIELECKAHLKNAYSLLLIAYAENTNSLVNELSLGVPLDNKTSLKIKSFMGCDLPVIRHKDRTNIPYYSFSSTTESLDKATKEFEKLKMLLLKKAELEASVTRLNYNIKKVTTRSNALKNITIPKYETIVSHLSNSIEEKEREEFARLKCIKQILTSD